MFSSSIKQILRTPVVKRSIISTVRPTSTTLRLTTLNRISAVRNYSGAHDEETFEEFTAR